jgi:hypothetical protein
LIRVLPGAAGLSRPLLPIAMSSQILPSGEDVRRRRHPARARTPSRPVDGAVAPDPAPPRASEPIFTSPVEPQHRTAIPRHAR